MIIIPTQNTAEQDRTDQFRSFAQRRANGEVMTDPVLLPPEERRLYVRRTLREDHQYRIKNRPGGAQNKFATLADSLFSFYRGTALLYYRDYAGTDAHLPLVFTVGDVHPENFGVMPNEDGAPFFGVNDFDEAYFAPFTYDVKRGAVGFYIASKVNGFSKIDRKRVVHAFAEGYVDALKEYATDDREKWHEFRMDNSPPIIRKLLKSARTERKDFLSQIIDLDVEEFISTDEIVPHTRHLADFQKIVDQYLKKNKIDTKTRGENFFKVKDVAVKRHSGTASLGWIATSSSSKGRSPHRIETLFWR